MYSVSQTEPSFLRHPVSTEIQRLGFQDGEVDTVLHRRYSTLSVFLMELEAIVLK